MPGPHERKDITVVIPPQHPKYYLRGGDLHVIAGNTLFRVHGYFFERDSSIFKTKLNPVSPGQVKEGTNDAPVVLDGITAEEFEVLLWVFYNPKYSLYDTDIETWKCILHLANKLDFKEVKELAVRELHLKRDLPLVEKMALYQHHQVDPRHLVPLFAELCSRDTPLSLEESQILGPISTYLVYSTREHLRAQPSDGGRSPLPQGLEEKDVFRAIESFFGIDHGSTLAFQQENGR
ncbi:hypothetical protein BYT27DRAFT_7196594 [Phlegmacium glaucopus]|nr:hypothetical protein BYT27DRAFT_7196594 [Phlegmacium glaucopus]